PDLASPERREPPASEPRRPPRARRTVRLGGSGTSAWWREKHDGDLPVGARPIIPHAEERGARRPHTRTACPRSTSAQILTRIGAIYPPGCAAFPSSNANSPQLRCSHKSGDQSTDR